MGYLANFLVYTFAMVGVIAVALLVFKSTTSSGCLSKSKYLKVIDSLSIGPRKTLYIVSTGNENFLIAGDVDKTNLISKLENSKLEKISNDLKKENRLTQKDNLDELMNVSFKETLQRMPIKTLADKKKVGIDSSIIKTKAENKNSTVMKNMLEKLRV